MKTVTLSASWKPKPGYVPGSLDIEGKLTYTGSEVWFKPELKIIERPKPVISSDDEVIIKVRACGICGSDVRLIKTDDDGYTAYSGLMSLPRVIGHEISGEIAEAGKNAINKLTNRIFETGEPVILESCQWCGKCIHCCEGLVNSCENIQSVGFNTDGGFAEYIKVKDKHCWSIRSLKNKYSKEDFFVSASLIEPAGTSYVAAIERGGGINPGENAVILGGGPIGLAAGAILKRAGANKLILSEISETRSAIGKKMGFDHIINPVREDLAERILEYTSGIGAKIYIETTGSPHLLIKDIENTIMRGRKINSTVVLVSKTHDKIPITGEIFQIRNANIVGIEGDTGSNIFPKLIGLIESGMDLTPMVTSRITLEEVPQKINELNKSKIDCKVVAVV